MDGPGHPQHDHDDGHVKQLTLEETAVDACSRKRHAVERGYFEDPYLRHFTRDTTYINSPLMNRGYWLRVRTVESAINRFVQALPEGAPFQVLSLGGGFDTLFFRWAALATKTDAAPAAQSAQPADDDGSAYEAREFALSHQSVAGAALRAGRLHRFVEVDQREVIEAKRRVIQRSDDVAAFAGLQAGQPVAGPLTEAPEASKADVYRMVAGDLRKSGSLCECLCGGATNGEAAKAAHEIPVFGKQAPTARLLDPAVPTLVIAECVLVYMHAAESLAVLRDLAETFAPAPAFAVLAYDAIRPTTPFGKQMISSLGARGLELRGIHDLPNPEAHKKRYAAELQFPSVACWTMRELFAQVPPAVQKRLQHIEMQDDYDEWCLVQEHYCMSWALRVGSADPDKPKDAPPRLFY